MNNIIWLTVIFIYFLLQIMFQSPCREKPCSDTAQGSPEKIHSIGDMSPRSRVQFMDDDPSLNITRSVDVMPSRNEMPYTEVFPPYKIRSVDGMPSRNEIPSAEILTPRNTVRSMDSVPSQNEVPAAAVLPSRVVSGVVQDEKKHILPYANLAYVTRENEFVTKTDGHGIYTISVPIEAYGTWKIEKNGRVFKDEYTYLFHSYDGFTILNFELHEIHVWGKHQLKHIR